MIKNFLRNFLFNYAGDQFCTSHNVFFLKDKNFQKAYNKACKIIGFDPNIHFRIHQIIWASQNVRKNTWGHRRVGHWNWFFNVSFVEFLQKLEFRKKNYTFLILFHLTK